MVLLRSLNGNYFLLMILLNKLAEALDPYLDVD